MYISKEDHFRSHPSIYSLDDGVDESRNILEETRETGELKFVSYFVILFPYTVHCDTTLFMKIRTQIIPLFVLEIDLKLICSLHQKKTLVIFIILYNKLGKRSIYFCI